MTVDEALAAEEYASELESRFADSIERLDRLSNADTLERLLRMQGGNWSEEQVSVIHGVLVNHFCKAIGRT